MDPKETTPTPEELQAEQEALAEGKADEVRAKIVSELGLSDDDQNKTLIDGLVQRELGHKKKLSEAIGQKIKYREQLKGPKPSTPVTPATQPLDAEGIRKQAEDATIATLEQRDLDEMDYPDEIKTEIKNVAKFQGVSVRKAAKTGYIQHLISEAVKAGKIDEAAVTRTPHSTPTAPQGKMPQFDMSTPEGRKAFDEWKKANGK